MLGMQEKEYSDTKTIGTYLFSSCELWQFQCHKVFLFASLMDNVFYK